MSKLFYRLNSLCTFLKQEKLIDDYDISHLKLEIKKELEHLNQLRFALIELLKSKGNRPM